VDIASVIVITYVFVATLYHGVLFLRSLTVTSEVFMTFQFPADNHSDTSSGYRHFHTIPKL
jgi:hypothetical protein